MPISITVTHKEMEFLKAELSKKFNLSILDTHDCRLLSEMIERYSGLPISYNTLRRFFQIVASSASSSCSLYSLNIMAKTLDFRCWATLQQQIKEFDLSYQNHLLQLFKKKKAIDHDLALSNISKFKFNDWNESYWLKIINRMALEFGDFDFLRKFFLLTLPVRDQLAIDKLYFAFQDIYSQLPEVKELKDLVIDLMEKSESIQQIIMMCYVDENKLDSYYGELLESFKVVFKKDPHQQLFYQLMQLQKLYNNKTAVKILKKEYEKAVSIFEQCDKQQLVTIVMGRLAAWRWILYKNDDVYLSLLNSSDQKTHVGPYVDFFNRLTILFEKPYFKLVQNKQMLDLFRYEKVALSFFHEHINNQVKLGFAINFFLQNDFQQAECWFRQTKSFVFDITMYDWYADWHGALEKKLLR